MHTYPVKKKTALVAMGDFAPKVQPPHLIRLKEPIIKCASSGELLKHPLVKSHELNGNLKVKSKRNRL